MSGQYKGSQTVGQCFVFLSEVIVLILIAWIFKCTPAAGLRSKINTK